MKTARVASGGGGGGGVNATERKWNSSKQEMGVKKEGVVLIVACHLNRVERAMALKLKERCLWHGRRERAFEMEDNEFCSFSVGTKREGTLYRIGLGWAGLVYKSPTFPAWHGLIRDENGTEPN